MAEIFLVCQKSKIFEHYQESELLEVSKPIQTSTFKWMLKLKVL